MQNDVAGGQRPTLLLKTFVRGYVTKDGKAVAPHADLRPERPKTEPGAGGMPRQAAEPKPKPETRNPKAKHYAQPRTGGRKYEVGQAVKLRGRDGVFKVVKIAENAVELRDEAGKPVVVRTGGTPMAKAQAPILLVKATGADPKRQGDKGAAPGGAAAKAKAGKPAAGKPAAGKPAAPGDASSKSTPIRERPEVPSRGAPDGEAEMAHGDRVKFQHGKVEGEGEIVASGADGVMVLDDAGREHPIRHDNLLGPADGAETPPAADAAAADAEMGGEVDADMGTDQDAAGEVSAMLQDADPSKLRKMLQALKVLAPFFGGKPAGKADAKPKPEAKPKAPVK